MVGISAVSALYSSTALYPNDFQAYDDESARKLQGHHFVWEGLSWLWTNRISLRSTVRLPVCSLEIKWYCARDKCEFYF